MRAKVGAASTPQQVDVFATDLEWMAIAGSAGVLARLSFGHPTPEAAIEALALGGLSGRRPDPAPWNQPLARRLKDYASGAPDDFRNVAIDLGPQTDFRRRVLQCCRRIPYASTRTYGQLAAEAGRRGAARAVGQCMAANPIPLVIPCHRVVAANGGFGGYSAAGGVRLKLRLLEMEAPQKPAWFKPG